MLQGFRLADDEADHAAALLALMDPPRGALIADLGCGFGELPRLWRQQRPDLEFILVNANPVQARNTPRGPGFTTIQADMHRVPLAVEAVDGVAFSWALCHADLDAALREAARITRPGGFLFVFDYERLSGDNAAAEAVSHARWYPRDVLAAAATSAGWRGSFTTPEGSDAVLRRETGPLYETVFGGLRPIVWRMAKVA